MATGPVVLVDFENVQAIDFSRLGPDTRLAVFAGENQRKVPIEVADGLQKLGARARWVRSNGVGPNALDFHIAFELGRLAQAGEKGPVFILSKDRGFDPLLEWLRAEHAIPARRVTSIAEAFPPAGTAPGSPVPIVVGPAMSGVAMAAAHPQAGPAHAPVPTPTPAAIAATPGPAGPAPAPAAAPGVASAPPTPAAVRAASPAAPAAPVAKGAPAKPPAKAPAAKAAPKPKAATPASAPAKKASTPAKKAAAKGGKAATPDSPAAKAKEILSRSRKAARPRRRSTLIKHVRSMFQPKTLADREVEAIIAGLLSKKWISEVDGAITYNF